MFQQRHCFRIVPDNIDLVTYLNDGVRPPINPDHFLVVEVNSPTEISSKIMSLEEMNAELREHALHTSL